MGHGPHGTAEVNILNDLPQLRPNEIYEWVQPELLPDSHPLNIEIFSEAWGTRNHLEFAFDAEFFGIFWKSIRLLMTTCCSCERCKSFIKEYEGYEGYEGLADSEDEEEDEESDPEDSEDDVYGSDLVGSDAEHEESDTEENGDIHDEIIWLTLEARPM